MIRRFNFTGRVKILQDSISLSISDINTTSVAFSCEVALQNYEFPSSANIFAQVYSKSYIRRRFSMGTIEEPMKLTSVPIPEFRNFPAFNLRIYVIDTSEHNNKILGRSSIVFSSTDEDGDGESSILPVRYVDDLEQVWKLDYDANLPYLKLNNKINGIRELVNSSESFRYTVLPAVLREILTHLFIFEDNPLDDTDNEAPEGKWAKFIKDTLGKAELLETLLNEDEDETSNSLKKFEAIDKIVEFFTLMHFNNVDSYKWA